MQLLRDKEYAPPSTTTETVRRTLRRLCEVDEVIVEGNDDYLKPHGVRRSLEKKLYTEVDAEMAQKALRHVDPETTSRMYADIEAGEVMDVTDRVFRNE